MTKLFDLAELRHRTLTIVVIVLSLTCTALSLAQSPVVGATAETAAIDGDVVLQTLQDHDASQALALLGNELDSKPDGGLSRADWVRLRLPAAAAGIHRALMQQSPEQRFEILSAWTLPTAQRASVRLLVTAVPHEAPPKMFARVLGQRPRDESFPIAQVGPLPGLFCSGWMLMQTADEVGRLSRLSADLQQLRDDGVPGADALWLLAQIASRRGDTDAVANRLTELDASLSDRVEVADELSNADWANVAIAVAGLTKESLQPLCERILDHYAAQPTPEQPLLRVAHATAVQVYRGVSPASVLYQNRLQHWTTASSDTAVMNQAGTPPSIWLTHEDHVLHLAGGWNDALLCRYPVVGDFEFVCETQTGGPDGTEGGLVYGGLHFEVTGGSQRMTIWDADRGHPLVKLCPFVRGGPPATFNRVSFRSTPAMVAFEANFHPMWQDDAAAQTSPWLGLRSHGHHRAVFRNLRLTGHPVIPRRVELFARDQLRGWQSSYYQQDQPPFSSQLETASQRATPEARWRVESSVVVGDATSSKTDIPSLLRYQRPLLDGESISYEFYHHGDVAVVHPAVGRMAFLMEPAGIRVRWLTDDPTDWTGLPLDNAVLDPLSRRGPKSLPIVPKDWNRVTVAVQKDMVHVTLNDQLVYQLAIDRDSPQAFGFYRANHSEPVKLRAVVMTGDWPEKLPADFLQQPLTLVSDGPTESPGAR